MKRPAAHHFRVSLTSSVRTRLTLWYLAVMVFIVFVFGGSLYATQTFLNGDAGESKPETQLYQDSQRFAQTYKQALLDRQVPTALHLNQSSREMVLLLRPVGSILDSPGQRRAERSDDRSHCSTGSLPGPGLVGEGEWLGLVGGGERLSHPAYACAEPERARGNPPGGIATPVSFHSLPGDLALSRHAGPADCGDRGLLAGGQSAAPGEDDYAHGQRNQCH